LDEAVDPHLNPGCGPPILQFRGHWSKVALRTISTMC